MMRLTMLAAAAATLLHLVHGPGPGDRVDLPLLPVVQVGDKTEHPALAWHIEGGALSGERLVGTGETADFTITVMLSEGDGIGAGLDVTIRYRKAVEVEREALRLTLPGAAHAVDRTLGWSAVEAPLRVDRGTPRIVATPRVAVIAGIGFAAAKYSPAGADTEVDLVLDDADAHPFAVYEQCFDKLPPSEEGGIPTGPVATTDVPPTVPIVSSTGGTLVQPRLKFSDLEKKKTLSRAHRASGEVVSAHATLYALPDARAFEPLIVERWPEGARAAVVFTDHADRTDPAVLRALLYGSSDPKLPSYGEGGFFGHGLKITKSFFARAWKGGLESDPAAQKLADELVEHGSEVASHSPTASADTRDVVAAEMPVFERWRATTWIDHEPYTNCEAISNQGWEEQGKYAIRDLLRKNGYLWIWEANDVAGFSGPRLDNVFTVGAPSAAAPVFFPLPMDPRLWVFKTTWFYGLPEHMGAALDEPAFDKLEKERGLFLGHTYFSPSPKTTHAAALKERIVAHEQPDGRYDLDGAFDAGLARLGERVKSGTLVSMTWEAAGTRLLALEDVVVTYLPDGGVQLDNFGEKPVDGLTVSVPEKGVDLRVEGADLCGAIGDTTRTEVWIDLGGRSTAVVRASKSGLPFPFLEGEPTRARLDE
jgi:hypothetical protein